jgi:hypothetical protein
MPYKLIKNQFGGADICQILILIAVVVVVYYLFIQSQPAVNSEPVKKVEKYSAHYDIAVSEPAFTSEEESNKKQRPAVDVTYTGVPYYHIPSRLTSENTYATPEETEKNEGKARLAVAKTYKRERTTDKNDEVMGRQKMDHDFGIVVENPRVYRNFKPSSVAYSPPFDTTSVTSIVTSSVPVSSTAARSYSSSSVSSNSSKGSVTSKGTKTSKGSKGSVSSDSDSSSVSASYTLTPPDYVSTAPSTGKPPRGITSDKSGNVVTVSSTPKTPVVSSALSVPTVVTVAQPTSLAPTTTSEISSVTTSATPASTSSAPSTTAAPSATATATSVAPKKKVVEKFTDVNKLYSAQDGYDLKTPLSKSLCSQKCCGYYWKENMGDLFKKNDTVGFADVGVGKKYRTSNVTCMGDGVAPPGCRCYTGEQQDLLATRGGNGSRFY